MPKNTTIEGMEEREKRFKNVEKVANKTVTKAAREAMKIARKDAKQRALKVKDSGRMLKSLRYRLERSRTKGKKVYRLGYFGDGWYGRFHEYGTSRMEATPILRPAVENNSEAIQKKVLEILIAGIGTVK